jgi:hypothetical protein
MKIKCNYRNCDNTLEGKRKGSKYCCVYCKSNEKKYIKRKAILINKYKETAMNEISLIKWLKEGNFNK